MLGVLLILASTFAYNGSAVLLAAVARRSGDRSPLAAVGRRLPGVVAVSLNVLGWALEVAALALIPLTLARLLNAAGLGILLVLARRTLNEPLGWRRALGAALISLGIAAAGFAPTRAVAAHASPLWWALLLVILGPGIALPYALRLLRRPVGPIAGASAAGLAYALSGILNKAISSLLHPLALLPLVSLVAAVTILGLMGFASELEALKIGYASVVVPLVLTLHTVVPILCAPLLFGEAWPAELFQKTILAGGIASSVAGVFLLARYSGRVMVEGR